MTPPDRREAARALRTLAARAWHRPMKAHDRNMTRKQLASQSIYEHQRKRRDRAGRLDLARSLASQPNPFESISMEPASATALAKVVSTLKDWPLWLLIAVAISTSVLYGASPFWQLVPPTESGWVFYAMIVAWVFVLCRATISGFYVWYQEYSKTHAIHGKKPDSKTTAFDEGKAPSPQNTWGGVEGTNYHARDAPRNCRKLHTTVSYVADSNKYYHPRRFEAA